MGPILALGVAIMVAAGLTLLPAMLAALGRRAFWPRRARRGAAGEPRCGGDRPSACGAAPARSPRPSRWCSLAGALGDLGGREPLDFSEAFRDPPESVEGAAADRASASSPAARRRSQIVTGFDAAAGAWSTALDRGPGRPVAGDVPDGAVDRGPAGPRSGSPTPTWRDDPFSDAAARRRSRACARAARAAAARASEVLVGGEVAEAYDTPRGAGARHAADRADHARAGPARARRAAARRRHAAVRDRRRSCSRSRSRSAPARCCSRTCSASRQRPEPDAVRVHLPRRAGRRLQRLPARPDPRGAGAAATRDAP